MPPSRYPASAFIIPIIAVSAAAASALAQVPRVGADERLRGGQDAIWEAALGSPPAVEGPLDSRRARSQLEWLSRFPEPSVISEPEMVTEVLDERTPRVGDTLAGRSDRESGELAPFENEKFQELLATGDGSTHAGLTVTSASRASLWGPGEELYRHSSGRDLPILTAYTLRGDFYSGEFRSRMSTAFVPWTLERPSPEGYFVEYGRAASATTVTTESPEVVSPVPPGAPGMYYQGGVWSAAREWAFGASTAELIGSFLEEEIRCPVCDGAEEILCRGCRGKKQFVCPDCRRSGKMVCRDCLGRGRTSRPTTPRCTSCSGSGKVRCVTCGSRGMIDCTHCGGEPLACRLCKGRRRLAPFPGGRFAGGSPSGTRPWSGGARW